MAHEQGDSESAVAKPIKALNVFKLFASKVTMGKAD